MIYKPDCRALLCALLLLQWITSAASAADGGGLDTPQPTKLEMVTIPGGHYVMGCGAGDHPCDADEKPQHPVKIDPFELARHEVTVGAFRHFAETQGYKTDAEQSDGVGCYAYQGGWKEMLEGSWRAPGFPQSENDPVVCVSWNDAKAYLQWLSSESGKQYRLPSESEWEYAARGGTMTKFWWGNQNGVNRANCDGCGSQWDEKRTAPVGSFRENPFGLYDMHGNVAEWTEDCWNESYVGAPSDGSAWQSGACQLRVLRGGSWDVTPRVIRSANRCRGGISNQVNLIGFRVARSLIP